MDVRDAKKFQGQLAVMIYQDKSGRITKRTVRILLVDDHAMIGFCYLRGKRRRFLLDQVLAIEAVKYAAAAN